MIFISTGFLNIHEYIVNKQKKIIYVRLNKNKTL